MQSRREGAGIQLPGSQPRPRGHPERRGLQEPWPSCRASISLSPRARGAEALGGGLCSGAQVQKYLLDSFLNRGPKFPTEVPRTCWAGQGVRVTIGKGRPGLSCQTGRRFRDSCSHRGTVAGRGGRKGEELSGRVHTATPTRHVAVTSGPTQFLKIRAKCSCLAPTPELRS